MAIHWPLFGWILVAEFVFALIVAAITRLFSKHLEGQTYGLVVLGVAGVVTIAGPVIGWTNVLALMACFGVTGTIMGVEYYDRVITQARKAKKAAEEMLDGHASADR